MSTTILLKRSLNTAIPASLANGEPAYTANGDVFYIGSNGTIVAIGGLRVPGVLTANQALVTNSTNMIDKVMAGNSTVNAVVNSLAFTLANSTVSFSYTKPTAAQVSSGDYFPNSGGGWSQVTGGTTNPAGANTNIQFNDSGSFGADAKLDWDKAVAALTVGNSTINVVTNSSSIVVGANVVLDTVRGFWGNSTVNAVQNSIGMALNGSQVVVNNSVIQNGANLFLDTVKVSVGNSTVNATVNSIGLSLNGSQVVVNNSVLQNGANVIVDTVKAAFGNSSVNTTINSVALALNGTQVVNSTGVSAGILYGNQVNSTANISFTGANVSFPNANLSAKDLNLTGNLVVQGTVTTVDATNLQVKDSIIKLADQNASDAIDIGFYGLYNDGSNRYRGLLHDASNGNFILFSNTLAEPTTTLDTSNTSLAIATLRAYLASGNLISNSTGVFIGANSTYAVQFVANSLTLTTPLVGTSGGTGLSSYTTGDILVGNSTNGLNKIAVPATDGSIVQWSAGGGVAWSATVDCGTF